MMENGPSPTTNFPDHYTSKPAGQDCQVGEPSDQQSTQASSFPRDVESQSVRTTSQQVLDNNRKDGVEDQIYAASSRTASVAPVEDVQPQSEQLPPLTKQETSGRPHSSFTSRQKVLIVLVATIGACFSGFTTNIYFPAIDTISDSLGVSVSQVNLSITTYMIFQGIAPSFISAISDVKGRRPGYVIGSAFYIAANLGLALNNSYAGLIVLRCIQSCGSSGMVTLAQATIADVVTSAERGKYISITSLSGILAPSLGPIIGGVLSQHLGWHSVFWFLLIAAGVYFIPLLLFFPETGRTVVGDGTIPPPKWNRTLPQMRRKNNPPDEENAEAETLPPPKPRKPINPLASLTILRDPETALLLTYITVSYAAFYAISTSITVQFGRIYHLDSTLQGLLFIPQSIGSLLSALTNAKFLDWNWRRHCRKLGIDADKSRQVKILTTKIPVEKARLDVGLPMATLPAILIIIYGWLLQAQVSIAGPIVIMVCLGYTTLCSFSSLNVLLIDLHRDRPATASAASNLTRCLFGAAASAVINPMFEALGNGWSFTIWGVMQACVLPGLWYVYLRGNKLRAARVEREEARKARAEERRKLKESGQLPKERHGSWFKTLSCLKR